MQSRIDTASVVLKVTKAACANTALPMSATAQSNVNFLMIHSPWSCKFRWPGRRVSLLKPSMAGTCGIARRSDYRQPA